MVVSEEPLEREQRLRVRASELYNSQHKREARSQSVADEEG